MTTQETAEVEVARVACMPSVGDFDDPVWERTPAVPIARYWSGELAPAERHAEARLLWTEQALLVRFVCRQDEPLVVSAEPRLDRKTLGLWERDVCEIFVAPTANDPRRYFEFEVAPTGEWVDLTVEWSPAGRKTDWEYRSGMTAAARLGASEIAISLRVPWSAFGVVPRTGDGWRANLFRCVGAGASRGYLAWRPTHTPAPSFHVPDKFGWLRFK